MNTKQQNPAKLGFKDYFGTAAMGLTDGMATALMTSFFMVYLTDYAGLGAFGAVVASSVLLFSRIFDAVNDPLEGWIMDRAKVGKYGKYKPFIILSIVMALVGVSCLFFVPAGAGAAFTCVWVIFFYLIYDMGASFFAPNLIYRAVTLDTNERGKLLIAPRIVSMMTGMVTAGLIAMVTGVNSVIGNMHDAFGLTVFALLAVVSVISLIGISLVKERHHAVQEAEDAPRAKFTDFFLLLKENAALRVCILGNIFNGFIWTFLFATMLYYIKWGLCTDLATGKVNNDAYGLYSAIAAMLMFLPLIIGTAIATPIMKKIGDPMKFARILLLCQAIPCGVLFVLQMVGLLEHMPWAFFLCTCITTTAIGCGYIPGATIDIECMDYQIYKNGKDRSGLCNAFTRFISKAQGAIGNSAIGFMLAGIGYIVDSTTGDYVGDLKNMPVMLNWFIVMMGLIPFILGMIAWFIYKHYPITKEIRADMREKLSK